MLNLVTEIDEINFLYFFKIKEFFIFDFFEKKLTISAFFRPSLFIFLTVVGLFSGHHFKKKTV